MGGWRALGLGTITSAARANVAESDRLHCLQFGMNDYLKKPLAQRDLADALARALTHLDQRGIRPILTREAALPA